MKMDYRRASGENRKILAGYRMNSGTSDKSFDHFWFWKQRIPERKGRKCRVLIRTKAGHNCLVEFEDGFLVITSQWAVRRLK
jgi:hypothetical protein